MSRAATPFDDRSFEVDGLTVESAADVVSFHGSLDIRQDQKGLAAARTLSAYLATLVATLEQKNRNSPLPQSDAIEAPVQRANPFG